MCAQKKIYPYHVSKDNVNREKQVAEQITKNLSDLLQFINSSRLMPISLPDLSKSKRIHRIKCKLGHGGSNIVSPDWIKNVTHIELNIAIFSNIQTLKII